MCRWFAYLSETEPCLLEDVLIVPEHGIAKQVHDHYLPYLKHYEPNATAVDTTREIAMRNKFFNADGFGIAWYNTTRAEFGECDGPRPLVYHILRQPLNDPNFTSICANTATRALFAHVRAASPGSVVTSYNNHPFTFGRWAFMHNGGIESFAAVRRGMLAEMSDVAAMHIQGTTDSEHLAMLFFTHLANLTDVHGPPVFEQSHPLEMVKKALEEAISATIRIQKTLLPALGIAFEASSLNICITDGEQMLAIRFRNHPTEHPPSLYFSTKAGVTLNRKYPDHPNGAAAAAQGPGPGPGQALTPEAHGRHFIIASEPSTYKKADWELVGKNECVMVRRDMSWTRAPVDVAF